MAGEGLHPSEVVVLVPTRTGEEELVVDPKSLEGAAVEIGWPVGRDGKFVLVELPRPTSTGSRRVWVDGKDLVPEKKVRATA